MALLRIFNSYSEDYAFHSLNKYIGLFQSGYSHNLIAIVKYFKIQNMDCDCVLQIVLLWEDRPPISPTTNQLLRPTTTVSLCHTCTNPGLVQFVEELKQQFLCSKWSRGILQDICKAVWTVCKLEQVECFGETGFNSSPSL